MVMYFRLYIHIYIFFLAIYIFSSPRERGALPVFRPSRTQRSNPATWTIRYPSSCSPFRARAAHPFFPKKPPKGGNGYPCPPNRPPLPPPFPPPPYLPPPLPAPPPLFLKKVGSASVAVNNAANATKTAMNRAVCRGEGGRDITE